VKRQLQGLSYRSQLNVLGVLMVFLVLGGLFVIWTAARNTETAIVADNRRSLAESVEALKRGIERRVEFLDAEDRASPLATPESEASRKLLTLVTEMTLQSATGVEGGFYTAFGTLVGYAFPTHEGGLKTDIPEAERPVILDVAARCLRSGEPVDDQIVGVRDVILFRAVPILHGGKREGVAWAMKRLSGLRSAEGRLSSFATLSLGLGALFCVGFAFYLARTIQAGVEHVKTGLRQVGGDLRHRLVATGHSEEIQEIAEAVNRLASQLEAQLAEHKRAEELARHADRLASLGQLVAGVAHEVRNPLATIKLRAQMLMEASDDGRARDSCAQILSEIERLDGLVNKLLIFGRTFAVNPSPADLNQVLLDRVQHFEDRAASQGIRLEAHLDPAALPAAVDAPKIVQVIDNLVQNALEAVTPLAGVVEIRSGMEGNTAWFQVHDNGGGISPELLRRVFDPFVTTKDHGSGLGLSISNEIVQMHNGRISVTSEHGKGSCFRVTLPLVSSEQEV
jgi:signal transduction histidine kinase